jgi:quercetin dioxygenase-like cupin family protein
VNGSADFAAVFERLTRTDQAEEVLVLGGVNVRMVRVVGGREGRWDSHAHSAEAVVVWSGDFTVEFSDDTLVLSAGQCCVVPIGARHRGTSHGGAEVILFQQAS